MRYIVTGGGTGGHIYPALAIIKEIKDSDKNAKILYIGTKQGLEAELVPKEGIDFKTVRVQGMPRRLNKKSFIALKELINGLKDAKKIIKDFKPDIVIGTGGYVSGPVVFMAKRMKIRAVIHEQNAFPGITNKILSRYVDRVLVTFDEATKYFKYPERVVKTGNPIRKEILNIKKEDAYNKLNIKNNKPFVLSFGGSGGQKKLNDAIFHIIKNYKLEDDFQLIHITGSRLFEDFMLRLKKEDITIPNNIRIIPYLYDMPEALNVADLVIGSSGAITLAEISALGVPSILIPKAYTAENHQEYNARFFEREGASIVILEKDLSGVNLYNTINKLINDKDRLYDMSLKCRKLGDKNASKHILYEINKLFK